MTIKTIQNLVSEAMSEIKTIDAEEAYQMVQDKNCNLIDLRESSELENTGSVEGASHIPRGMLEVYLDPSSPCLLYTSPSPRDLSTSRMPSSA